MLSGSVGVTRSAPPGTWWPTDAELAHAAGGDRGAVAVIYDRYAEPCPRLLPGGSPTATPSSSSWPTALKRTAPL